MLHPWRFVYDVINSSFIVAFLNGSCIRDYIHVSDLAMVHLLALRHLEEEKPSQFLNLGNTKRTSVLELIKAAKSVMGLDIPVELT